MLGPLSAHTPNACFSFYPVEEEGEEEGSRLLVPASRVLSPRLTLLLPAAVEEGEEGPSAGRRAAHSLPLSLLLR